MIHRNDVAVVGLGAMGSATVYQLARAGCRVRGLDAFTPPHALGSSHGETRIIREAYFEHPLYVPLVQRAYTLWADLEARVGRPLLVPTGGLMLGRPESTLVAGALTSARTHRLAHECLSAAELRRDYPAFRLPDDVVGVREPRAGVLLPERIIASHLALAAAHGAALGFDEPVLRWSADRDGARVVTSKAWYDVGTLILCAGAWMPRLTMMSGAPARTTSDASRRSAPSDMPEPSASGGPAPIFTVERNTVHWFTPPPAAAPRFARAALPIFLAEQDDGRVFYGFPALTTAEAGAEAPAGVKVARHHAGQPTTVDTVTRDVAASEVAEVRSWVDTYLPDLRDGWRRATVCLYTNTPDGHFVIDQHPAHERVWIVSPCSGHGFKFSSAIGELLADLVLGRDPRFDLTPFRLDRFATAREAHHA